MLFWFKKKTVHIDCFTSNRSVYENFPITKATKYLPDWYKRLPKHCYAPGSPMGESPIPGPTMKKCQGFLNYFKNSLAIPAWDYLYITATEDNKSVNSMDVEVRYHSQLQYGSFLDETFAHHKIVVPWLLYCKHPTLFMYTFPSWCYEPYQNPDRLFNLPGAIEFKYQHAVNYNFFTRKPKSPADEYRITFEPLKPLAFLTPMEDVDVKLKLHYISREEYDGRTNFVASLGALDHYKLRKQIKELNEPKKCPLGFGK